MRLWRESDRRFGARTSQAILVKAEPRATLSRVRSSMRRMGIGGVMPKARKRATIPDPCAPERPDLVRRRFNPPVPTTVLVGDITYLKTGQG